MKNDMFHGRQREMERAAPLVIGAVGAASELATESGGRLLDRDGDRPRR